MNLDVEVDVSGVRGCAAGLAGVGARVAAGVGGMPEPVAVPPWATGDAAASVGDATRSRLAAIGSDIALAAQQIIAAVVDYEAADERAVTRLRSAR